MLTNVYLSMTLVSCQMVSVSLTSILKKERNVVSFLANEKNYCLVRHIKTLASFVDIFRNTIVVIFVSYHYILITRSTVRKKNPFSTKHYVVRES